MFFYGSAFIILMSMKISLILLFLHVVRSGNKVHFVDNKICISTKFESFLLTENLLPCDCFHMTER